MENSPSTVDEFTCFSDSSSMYGTPFFVVHQLDGFVFLLLSDYAHGHLHECHCHKWSGSRWVDVCECWIILSWHWFLSDWLTVSSPSWGFLLHDLSLTWAWVRWRCWDLFLLGHNLCWCHVHPWLYWNPPGKSAVILFIVCYACVYLNGGVWLWVVHIRNDAHQCCFRVALCVFLVAKSAKQKSCSMWSCAPADKMKPEYVSVLQKWTLNSCVLFISSSWIHSAHSYLPYMFSHVWASSLLKCQWNYTWDTCKGFTKTFLRDEISPGQVTFTWNMLAFCNVDEIAIWGKYYNILSPWKNYKNRQNILKPTANWLLTIAGVVFPYLHWIVSYCIKGEDEPMYSVLPFSSINLHTLPILSLPWTIFPSVRFILFLRQPSSRSRAWKGWKQRPPS